MEVLGDADAEGLVKASMGVKRTTGNMSTLSGANGLSYLEFKSRQGAGTGRGWGGWGGRGRGQTPKPGYQGDKAKALGKKLLNVK